MTLPGTPAVHATEGFDRLSEIEQNIENVQNRLDPFNPENDIGKIPFYASGAKSLIRVGGKPLGVSPTIRWSVSYNGTPINTIDTPHPWDIELGPMRITADIRNIMDPTKGLEHDAMFSVMQAAVHQPLVEIQVLDRSLGTSLFFARGMFTEVAGDVSTGNLGTFQARFVGVAYQHYVNQKFKPYDTPSASLNSLVEGLESLF